MTTETVLEGWYDCDVPSEHDKKDDEAIRLIHARQKKLGSSRHHKHTSRAPVL